MGGDKLSHTIIALLRIACVHEYNAWVWVGLQPKTGRIGTDILQLSSSCSKFIDEIFFTDSFLCVLKLVN